MEEKGIVEKYPIGTIREWKGRKYIKVAPRKWKIQCEKAPTAQKGARK